MSGVGRPWLLLGLLTLVAVAAPAERAAAQEETRTVEGQVVNGTRDAGAADGLSVVFHMEGATTHQHRVTPTDEEGRFRFEGIEPDPALTYGVSVEYQGALYGQDVDLLSGSPPSLALTVYEATDEEGTLSTSLASVLLGAADESSHRVSALEIMTIVNSSDRAYVPGSEPMRLPRFGLPAGARNLQVDSGLPGAEFIQVDLGFALLSSIPPGEHEVMYAYDFPVSGSAADFSKSLPYGATLLRVLALEGEMSLASRQMEGPDTVLIGERSYYLMQAADVPWGSRISVELRDLPGRSTWGRLTDRLDGLRFEYAAPAGLSAFMLALTAYAVWRRGGRQTGGDE